MSEVKMSGKTRRAITRADEGEVRSRVARATGGADYPQAVLWANDRASHLAGWRCGLETRAFREVLASVGIFPGRDGWEIEDAPPVDRAQAIRDALIERLTCSPCRWSRLLNTLNGENGVTFATVEEIRAALASIGAVADGDRWRLSSGAPPGWEWWRSEWGGLYLCPVGSLSKIHDSIANVTAHDALWSATEPREDGPVVAKGKATGTESACAAALLACRRAGLFALRVATEPTDAQRDPAHEATIADLEAQIASLVARLASMATERNAPVDPVQAAASAMLQRETIDPAWGALEARAVRAETERDDARALAAQVSVDREAAWEAAAKNGRERDEARSDLRGVAQARDSFQVMYEQAADARDAYQRSAVAAEGKLAAVIAERDELVARKNHTGQVRDAWRRRAEHAEATVEGMGKLIAEATKAAT